MIRIWLFFLAVLLFACASVGPQSLPLEQVSPSSVQHPGVSMGFELKIFNPTGATLKATYTEASPGGLVDRFEWRVSGDGNCIELTFYGRPDRLDVADLDIVQFRLVNVKYAVDGSNLSDTVFTGQVIDKPDNRAKQKQVYRVVGLKDWLRLVRQNLNLANQSISSTVDSIKNLLPAFISGQAATIGSGFGSRPFSLGAVSAKFALDDLAKSSIVPSGQKPVTWGLDRFGRLFFKRPTDAVTIPFSSVLFNRENLRIQSENVVTAVTLTLGQSDPSDGVGEEYRKPHAITYRVQDAAHTTYNREEVGKTVSNVVFELAVDSLAYYRGGLNLLNVPYPNASGSYGPLINSTDLTQTYVYGGFPNAAEYAAISDEDLSTGFAPPMNQSSTPLSGWFIFDADPPPGHMVIGARWVIDAAGFIPITGSPQYANAILVTGLNSFPPEDVNKTATIYGTTPTTDYREAGVYSGSAVFVGKDLDLKSTTRNKLRIYVRTPTDGASNPQVVIRLLKLICVKLDVLDQAAKSLIKLPAAVVEKVELPGAYLYPFSVLTITGTPGGTITGDATEYSYLYSVSGGLKTTVSLGSSDASESARVMKLMAQDLDAAVGVSARVYSDRR